MKKIDLEYFEKIQANEKLNNILKYSRENFIPTMLTNTGKLLYQYIKKYQPKNILEIGTAIGYSGIVMLIASENKSQLLTIEKDELRVIMAKNNFDDNNLSKNVEIINGDASEVISKLHLEMTRYDDFYTNTNKTNYQQESGNKLKSSVFCDKMNSFVEKESCNTVKMSLNNVDAITKKQLIQTKNDKDKSNVNETNSYINNNQKFDFIFLDGSKSQYIKQIDMLLDMLSDKGVIFIDDALYMYNIYKEGEVPHKHRSMIKNLRNFVIKILDNQNIDKKILNIDEGIIIVKKCNKNKSMIDI